VNPNKLAFVRRRRGLRRGKAIEILVLPFLLPTDGGMSGNRLPGKRVRETITPEPNFRGGKDTCKGEGPSKKGVGTAVGLGIINKEKSGMILTGVWAGGQSL